MTLIESLHQYLEQHFPRDVRHEPTCTCGEANHARIVFFRLNGQPATAVLPEDSAMTTELLRDAFGSAFIEQLAEDELVSIWTDSELGHTQPFDNPFGGTTFLDESLLGYKELVFCPRMFARPRGQCFRAPTKEFLALTHALTLRMVPSAIAGTNDWAV